jgi:hypothetical protein
VDTWGAQLKHGKWPKSRAVCSIEDPFDAQENCSRAVQLPSQLQKIQLAAEKAIQSLSACSKDINKKTMTHLGNGSALVGVFGNDIVSSAQKQHVARCTVLLKPRNLVLKREKLPIELAKIKDKVLFTQIAAVNHSSFRGFEDWSAWNQSQMGNFPVNVSHGIAGGMVQHDGRAPTVGHSDTYNIQYTAHYIRPPFLVPTPPLGKPIHTAEMHSIIPGFESIAIDREKGAQPKRKNKPRRRYRGPKKSAPIDQHGGAKNDRKPQENNNS